MTRVYRTSPNRCRSSPNSSIPNRCLNISSPSQSNPTWESCGPSYFDSIRCNSNCWSSSRRSPSSSRNYPCSNCRCCCSSSTLDCSISNNSRSFLRSIGVRSARISSHCNSLYGHLWFNVLLSGGDRERRIFLSCLLLRQGVLPISSVHIRRAISSGRGAKR